MMYDRPKIISADAAYDALGTRQYNRKRGIKSNISFNKRSWRSSKRRRPIRFDPELYKNAGVIEGSSAGLRRLGRLIRVTGDLNTYSWD